MLIKKVEIAKKKHLNIYAGLQRKMQAKNKLSASSEKKYKIR